MMATDWLESNTHMIKYLQGTGDKIRLYTDAKGIPLPHVDDGFKTGNKGANVELTIDLDMQEIVERELLQAMEKYDATQALAIVMNPKRENCYRLPLYRLFIQQNIKM